MADWRRYLLGISTVAQGPYPTTIEDELCEDGRRQIVEVYVTVQADVYCRRCDDTAGVLPAEEIDLGELEQRLDKHEAVCVAAPTSGGDDA